MFTRLLTLPININKVKNAVMEFMDIFLPYGKWATFYQKLTEPCGIQFIYADHNNQDPGILHNLLKQRKIYYDRVEFEDSPITYRNIYYVCKSFNQNLNNNNALQKKRELEEYLRFFANLKEYIRTKHKNITALKAFIVLASFASISVLFLPLSVLWVSIGLLMIAPIVLKTVLKFYSITLSDINEIVPNIQKIYGLEKELYKQSRNFLGKNFVKDNFFYDNVILSIEKINENTEEIYDNYCGVFYDVVAADEKIFDVNNSIINSNFWSILTTEQNENNNTRLTNDLSKGINHEYKKNSP